LDVQSVEGVVTLDGEPFGGVTITLYPNDASGRRGYASTDAQGHYQISTEGGTVDGGTLVGSYGVGFNKEVADGPEGSEKTKNLVPEKYRLPETSGIEIQVEKGKNIHDFPLVSK
jgi:hypothetical protein